MTLERKIHWLSLAVWLFLVIGIFHYVQDFAKGCLIMSLAFVYGISSFFHGQVVAEEIFTNIQEK